MCHAYCHAFLSHFCRAIQGGIKVKYIYISEKQSNGDDKNGQNCVHRTIKKPQKFPKVTKEPGTVYLM